MPITGTTLAEAARTFCDHLNRVLASTLTQTRAVLIGPTGVGDDPKVQVTFRQRGEVVKAPLHTRYGQMGLVLGQVCGSIVNQDRLHELRTLNYRYCLYPENTEEPIIRWEYEKEIGPNDLWCRHHVQGPIEVRLNRDTTFCLNDVHLPTGYVTFEEILRFCIVDLDANPLQPNWHDTLTESYRRFRVDFVQ